MVAGALGGKVTVNGVNRNSAQGDRKIAELLARFGAKVTQTDTSVTVEKGELNAIDIDASQIPDLVPVLTVCAAFAKGTTRIYNAERLRIKECDRLTATAKLINDLGGKVTELPDGLVIEGIDTLKGGFCEGFNDHRIVMSAGVCAVRLGGEIESSYALSINKSYPDFYIDYNNIGGKAMSSTYGDKIKISVFGESHGNGIGVVIDGLPAGFEVDFDRVLTQMARRAPGKDKTQLPEKKKTSRRFFRVCSATS